MQGPLGCMRQNRVQSDLLHRHSVDLFRLSLERWSLERWSLEWWVRTEAFSDRNRNMELEEIFFTISLTVASRAY